MNTLTAMHYYTGLLIIALAWLAHYKWPKKVKLSQPVEPEIIKTPIGLMIDIGEVTDRISEVDELPLDRQLPHITTTECLIDHYKRKYSQIPGSKQDFDELNKQLSAKRNIFLDKRVGVTK